MSLWFALTTAKNAVVGKTNLIFSKYLEQINTKHTAFLAPASPASYSYLRGSMQITFDPGKSNFQQDNSSINR